MADKEIEIHPFERHLAAELGLTPTEVHIAIELGVHSDEILGLKPKKWQDRREELNKKIANLQELSDRSNYIIKLCMGLDGGVKDAVLLNSGKPVARLQFAEGL